VLTTVLAYWCVFYYAGTCHQAQAHAQVIAAEQEKDAAVLRAEGQTAEAQSQVKDAQMVATDALAQATNAVTDRDLCLSEVLTLKAQLTAVVESEKRNAAEVLVLQTQLKESVDNAVKTAAEVLVSVKSDVKTAADFLALKEENEELKTELAATDHKTAAAIKAAVALVLCDRCGWGSHKVELQPTHDISTYDNLSNN
jgi:hypothetical protein